MFRPVATLLAIILLTTLFVCFSRDESGPLVRSRLLMGTVVEIRLFDEDAGRYEDAVTAAFVEMERIEALMSPHRSASEISRLSAVPEALDVSPETVTVVRQALEVSRASNGAFDIGLGRLIRLWGFAEGEPNIPTSSEIQESLPGAGPESLVLFESRIVKSDPRIAVDLGGVAKGYAIDRAIGVLQAAGVVHASVNAGGDMRLLGDRAGQKWRIGIQHPRRAGEILARIDLADTAVVTSGDYERFFERDGIRYHHILDPRTGYPATACQAVTVVAKDAMLADALATAAFVLGPAKGLELLKRFNAEGIIVQQNGEVVVTNGLQEQVVWP